MIALIALALLTLTAFAGGVIALFAGRRFYALWLGFGAFFITSRLFDLVSIHITDIARDLAGLLVAILVVVLVVWLRDRVIRFVPPVGGFIVSALVAERLLGIVYPEAGKVPFI